MKLEACEVTKNIKYKFCITSSVIVLSVRLSISIIGNELNMFGLISCVEGSVIICDTVPCLF